MRNNILVNEDGYRGAISVWADSLSGFSSDYNVVVPRFTTDDGDSVQTLAQWQAAGRDVHSKAATAGQLFVNWPAGDYHLKAGAAAINAGTATGAPAVDWSGQARPLGGGVDAGAIEFWPLAADFDASGAVVGADLGALRGSFGEAGSARKPEGDADGDWDIDGADFLTWQRQAGQTGAGTTLSLVSVAEPGSGWSQWLAASLGVFFRRTVNMGKIGRFSSRGI